MKTELANICNVATTLLKSRQRCRLTAIALLADKNGISEAGYFAFRNMVATISPGSCDDIFVATKVSDGRYYLQEENRFVA